MHGAGCGASFAAHPDGQRDDQREDGGRRADGQHRLNPGGQGVVVDGAARQGGTPGGGGMPGCDAAIVLRTWLLTMVQATLPMTASPTAPQTC